MPAGMADFSDKTVLVVDDDARNERMLVRILSASGFANVLSTTDSASVLQLCERHRPDFLVLDLTMPDPDGFVLLGALTQRIGGEPPPRVAILSGHDHPMIEQRAIKLGAAAVVAKTLPHHELVARLKQAFSDPAPDDR